MGAQSLSLLNLFVIAGTMIAVTIFGHLLFRRRQEPQGFFQRGRRLAMVGRIHLHHCHRR